MRIVSCLLIAVLSLIQRSFQSAGHEIAAKDLPRRLDRSEQEWPDGCLRKFGRID